MNTIRISNKKQKSKQSKAKEFFCKKHKIKKQHITDFLHDLLNLLNSGIPLLDSLDIIKNSMAVLQEIIIKLKTHLESGNSFSSALSLYPQYFDSTLCSLVNAGEQSGQLTLMLEKINRYRARNDLINKQIKKALFYPCTVLILAALITTFMLVFVIPRFAQMFNDFGAQLPWFTQWVLGASEFIQNKGIFIITGLIILIIGLIKYQNKTQKLTLPLWNFLFGCPILKKFIPIAIYARINSTLATLIQSGLPLNQAIASTSAIAGHPKIIKSMQKIYQQIDSGESFYHAIKSARIFPTKMVQLIAIGEKSGTIDKMLEHCADNLEQDLAKSIDRMGDLIEPLMMAILGIIIGGLVIAMYLPLFKLGNVL